MYLSLGLKELRSLFKAMRDKNVNKPVAYETSMIYLVDHMWDEYYFMILAKTFILNCLPLIALILLQIEPNMSIVILNYIMQTMTLCYEII